MRSAATKMERSHHTEIYDIKTGRSQILPDRTLEQRWHPTAIAKEAKRDTLRLAAFAAMALAVLLALAAGIAELADVAADVYMEQHSIID